MLVRTNEELQAAKAQSKVQWDKLPDRSMFGDDNRAAEKLTMSIFDKLLEGKDPETLEDSLYDMSDMSNAMGYVTSEAIALCEWAMGSEDDSFEVKEG